MAKIKLTKNELKQQRDALKRFERYLPTLQLKKQQLQLEARRAREQLEQLRTETAVYLEELGEWCALITDERLPELAPLLVVKEWRTGVRSTAGIDTPTFEAVEFEDVPYDLFTTPMWYDDAVAAARRLTEMNLRERLLKEHLRLIEQELRTVTQRVNLFEKVKIPEAVENIRRINIHLGDQQTSAVGRAKIAKEKCRSRELAATPA